MAKKMGTQAIKDIIHMYADAADVGQKYIMEMDMFGDVKNPPPVNDTWTQATVESEMQILAHSFVKKLSTVQGRTRVARAVVRAGARKSSEPSPKSQLYERIKRLQKAASTLILTQKWLPSLWHGVGATARSAVTVAGALGAVVSRMADVRPRLGKTLPPSRAALDTLQTTLGDLALSLSQGSNTMAVLDPEVGKRVACAAATVDYKIIPAMANLKEFVVCMGDTAANAYVKLWRDIGPLNFDPKESSGESGQDLIEVDEDDFAELECMRSTFNKLGRLIPSLYPAGDDALPTKASSVYKVRWENSDLQSAAQSAFIQTAGVVNATVGIPKILVGGANIVKDSKYAAKGFMTILKWVFKGEGDDVDPEDLPTVTKEDKMRVRIVKLIQSASPDRKDEDQRELPKGVLYNKANFYFKKFYTNKVLGGGMESGSESEGDSDSDSDSGSDSDSSSSSDPSDEDDGALLEVVGGDDEDDDDSSDSGSSSDSSGSESEEKSKDGHITKIFRRAAGVIQWMIGMQPILRELKTAIEMFMDGLKEIQDHFFSGSKPVWDQLNLPDDMKETIETTISRVTMANDVVSIMRDMTELFNMSKLEDIYVGLNKLCKIGYPPKWKAIDCFGCDEEDDNECSDDEKSGSFLQVGSGAHPFASSAADTLNKTLYSNGSVTGIAFIDDKLKELQTMISDSPIVKALKLAVGFGLSAEDRSGSVDPNRYFDCPAGRTSVAKDYNKEVIYQKDVTLFKYSFIIPPAVTFGIPVKVTVKIIGYTLFQLESGTCRAPDALGIDKKGMRGGKIVPYDDTHMVIPTLKFGIDVIVNIQIDLYILMIGIEMRLEIVSLALPVPLGVNAMRPAMGIGARPEISTLSGKLDVTAKIDTGFGVLEFQVGPPAWKGLVFKLPAMCSEWNMASDCKNSICTDFPSTMPASLCIVKSGSPPWKPALPPGTNPVMRPHSSKRCTPCWIHSDIDGAKSKSEIQCPEYVMRHSATAPLDGSVLNGTSLTKAFPAMARAIQRMSEASGKSTRQNLREHLKKRPAFAAKSDAEKKAIIDHYAMFLTPAIWMIDSVSICDESTSKAKTT